MLIRAASLLFVLSLACDSGAPQGAAAVAGDAKAEAVAGAGAAVEAKSEVRVAATAEVTVLRPVAEVQAAVGKALVLRAADLELSALTARIARGEVKSAGELELLLNAPGGAFHRVDIDADGALDYLQIVEVRADGAIDLQIRAVPSSKLDASLAVLLATIAVVRAEAKGAVEVVARFAAEVEGGAEVRIEHALQASFDAGAVKTADVSAGAFVSWAFAVGRPPHVSTHLTTADIVVAADGGVSFSGDATAALTAAQLASMRAALKVDATIDAAADARAEARAQLDVATRARAEAEAELDALSKQKAKLEHSVKSGVKVGGGAKAEGGVSFGGSLGGGVKVGGGAKAGGGIKIGK